MTHIQFGWSVPAGAREKELRSSYLADVQRGLDLVEGHYDSAWFVDHLQFDGADLMEGWTAVSYLAAQNPQFQWGHAVLCQSFRNPTLVAKMAATLQYLSGGRFILGLGAGWKEDEYRSYGYDFPPAGQRVDQLDEYLQIIKTMWRDERATVHGKYYHVEEAWCEPKPDPLPTIMVGAFKPRMMRIAARHADWWSVSWTGIDEYRNMVAECERACAEEGRDPATLRRTWFGGCSCAPTEEEAIAQTRGRFGKDTAFVGTPKQLIEQLRPFIELGVDYFMLGSAGFPELTTLELLKNEVLPAIRGT